MLYRKIITVCFQIHAIQINCGGGGDNVDLLNLKHRGTNMGCTIVTLSRLITEPFAHLM